MSQLKKYILILFLIPLLVKFAFVQAIEENSSDMSATDAEIAFHEAIIQKPVKKIVPWYKKRIFWSDLIIVGTVLSGSFFHIYKNSRWFNDVYKHIKKNYFFVLFPEIYIKKSCKNFDTTSFDINQYPNFAKLFNESNFYFASHLSDKQEAITDLRKLASEYENNINNNPNRKKSYDFGLQKRIEQRMFTCDLLNKLTGMIFYFKLALDEGLKVSLNGSLRHIETTYLSDLSKITYDYKKYILKNHCIQKICALLNQTACMKKKEYPMFFNKQEEPKVMDCNFNDLSQNKKLECLRLKLENYINNAKYDKMQNFVKEKIGFLSTILNDRQINAILVAAHRGADSHQKAYALKLIKKLKNQIK